MSLTPADRLVLKLVKRARKGDRTALVELQRLEPGYLDRLLEACGDLGRQTEQVLIDAICCWDTPVKRKGDQLRIEGLRRRAEEIRIALSVVHESPLERLLTGRVVCCWIAVCQADMDAAGWPGNQVSEGLQKYVDRCHRRFSMACKDLATVHKLLAPSVQVNIGKEQRIGNVFPRKAEQPCRFSDRIRGPVSEGRERRRGSTSALKDSTAFPGSLESSMVISSIIFPWRTFRVTGAVSCVRCTRWLALLRIKFLRPMALSVQSIRLEASSFSFNLEPRPGPSGKMM